MNWAFKPRGKPIVSQKLEHTEKVIENMILNYLRFRGVFAWKNDTVGIWDQKRKVYRKKSGAFHMTGQSDILGIFENRFLAIEVKSKKGKARPEQTEFLKQVNENGGIGFIARSIEDVENYLGPVPGKINFKS